MEYEISNTEKEMEHLPKTRISKTITEKTKGQTINRI